MLDERSVTIPERSFGIDSSRILEELMGVSSRNAEADTARNPKIAPKLATRAEADTSRNPSP